jgi:hypothetical protein
LHARKEGRVKQREELQVRFRTICCHTSTGKALVCS